MQSVSTCAVASCRVPALQGLSRDTLTRAHDTNEHQQASWQLYILAAHSNATVTAKSRKRTKVNGCSDIRHGSKTKQHRKLQYITLHGKRYQAYRTARLCALSVTRQASLKPAQGLVQPAASTTLAPDEVGRCR